MLTRLLLCSSLFAIAALAETKPEPTKETPVAELKAQLAEAQKKIAWLEQMAQALMAQRNACKQELQAVQQIETLNKANPYEKRNETPGAAGAR